MHGGPWILLRRVSRVLASKTHRLCTRRPGQSCHVPKDLHQCLWECEHPSPSSAEAAHMYTITAAPARRRQRPAAAPPLDTAVGGTICTVSPATDMVFGVKRGQWCAAWGSTSGPGRAPAPRMRRSWCSCRSSVLRSAGHPISAPVTRSICVPWHSRSKAAVARTARPTRCADAVCTWPAHAGGTRAALGSSQSTLADCPGRSVSVLFRGGTRHFRHVGAEPDDPRPTANYGRIHVARKCCVGAARRRWHGMRGARGADHVDSRTDVARRDVVAALATIVRHTRRKGTNCNCNCLSARCRSACAAVLPRPHGIYVNAVDVYEVTSASGPGKPNWACKPHQTQMRSRCRPQKHARSLWHAACGAASVCTRKPAPTV